jgi:uncharacterized protein (DUF58 family)
VPNARPGYFSDLLLTMRWYTAMGICAGLFVLAFFFPALLTPVAAITIGVLGITIFDYCLLFLGRSGLSARRSMPPRFSLGDENMVRVSLQNGYSFRASVLLIDELPVQFQERSWRRRFDIAYRSAREITYPLRPTTRGEYAFGRLLAYVSSPVGLVRRRFMTGEETVVKVYPSFLHLRRYQLLAVADNAVAGAKKVRRLGHSMEFEKIKSYVQGDDIRSINWKASARTGDLMVNTYTDARQQLIYCFLDKGRAMKMPFDGLTLLDHSINAALALLNVALIRQDKAGLLTFSQKVNDVVAADRRSGQLNLLLEALYRQETDYRESDYEALWMAAHRRLSQRSFILLFTNFETMSSLERQLPYLRRMAQRHLLCVVFFQNTLLKTIHETQPDTVEGIYIKTIAERFDFEKRQIVKELRRHGILAILTTPQSLSVDVINKYLELKAKQMV